MKVDFELFYGVSRDVNNYFVRNFYATHVISSIFLVHGNNNCIF